MRKVLVLGCFLVAGCSSKVNSLYQPPPAVSSLPAPPVEESLYRKEVMERLLSTLREEPTPLAVPPTVLRVFVLPYVSETGSLKTSHYLYLRVDEGRWILGDYLLQRGQPIREFRPLEEEKK